MSVVTSGSTRRITEPPGPPLPPSGPPRGLNFSRCTDVQTHAVDEGGHCHGNHSFCRGAGIEPRDKQLRPDTRGTVPRVPGLTGCSEVEAGYSTTMLTTRRPRRVPNSTAP